MESFKKAWAFTRAIGLLGFVFIVHVVVTLASVLFLLALLPVEIFKFVRETVVEWFEEDERGHRDFLKMYKGVWAQRYKSLETKQHTNELQRRTKNV